MNKNRAVLQALARAMEFKPHPGQVKVLEAFLTHRFIVVVAGRRWGKTKCMSIPCVYTISQKDTAVLAMSKTYKLAKKLWRYIVADCKLIYGPGFSKYINNSEMTINTPWGSRFELGTAENPDSILGDGYDVVIGDEAATLKEIILQQNLLPSARDRRGTVMLITTPRGFNYIHDIYQKGQRGEGGWWSYRGSARENYYVYDDEEWELAKEQTDPLLFQQEYEASFVVFADQVYSDFTETRNTITELPDLTGWHHYLTIDPGYRHCAMLWAAHNPVTNELIFYKEVNLEKTKHEDVLQQIVLNEPAATKDEPQLGYRAIISDIAGRKHGDDTGQSLVTWMRDNEWMSARNYFITTHKQGISTGISLVRSRILNALGKTTLKVYAPACPRLVKMHQMLSFDEGREVYVKDGVEDHRADAERYLVFHIDRTMRGGSHTDL